ncbi:hypothetical protein ACXR0O_19030 [Verrucomicrobiota bacterium sgz303538]
MRPVNPKGKPVPVRFKEDEQEFLVAAAQATGMPAAELIRRAVRLVRREQQAARSFGFLVDLAA